MITESHYTTSTRIKYEEHRKLASEIEKFLKKGGEIKQAVQEQVSLKGNFNNKRRMKRNKK